jgi:Tfp pilus assembly protein PilF
MPEKIVRVRRKRRIRPFPGIDTLPFFRFRPPPRHILIGAAAIVVAFLIALALLTYGSKVYGQWHESRLLQRATAMLQKKDYRGANETARQVLQIHQDSLPAFYILAEASEKENLEETVSWRAQIARLLPDNVDTQLNLASAALRFGQIDLARKTLDRVPKSARDLAEFHVIAGWLARAEGNLDDQEQQFAAAVKKEPNNDVYQFNLAALEIRSLDPEKSDKARESLSRLTKSQPFRTAALRTLLNDALDRNDLQTADKLAQDLQMSEQVTFADYLLCLNLYRKLDRKKFEALLEKMKPVAVRDPSNLAQLMDWMNGNGMAEDVLKWMEKLPAETSARPPAAISVAESFAEVKNWSRLRRWTRSGSWNEMEYLRLAYQAYAAHQSRQTTADAEFDSLWHAAEHAANDQPDREVQLARLATTWNLPIESEELWLRLAKNPPTRRESLDALYRLYRANNDLKRLYEVLQRLHETSPNEVPITANLARLGLNIDQNTKEDQQLAKAVYDRAPNDVNCAVTYAFSLYIQGRTTEGLNVIKKLPEQSLHDPHAAVYVAVLLLDDNQTDAAKPYIEIAKRGPIYAEEKRLLQDQLTKVTGGSSPTPSPTVTPRPQPSVQR